ncbi:hypothetical protein NDU88_005917 [Pleurodeles waltl]|uniref:Uncharacterized protein n=1 Tax=Pleurodeles waltl TaxID=8319 RepID=A0AAV7VMP4_PLEWA|nr:hypothetical protein NDU88_005917 [Pleurodeles waltl]
MRREAPSGFQDAECGSEAVSRTPRTRKLRPKRFSRTPSRVVSRMPRAQMPSGFQDAEDAKDVKASGFQGCERRRGAAEYRSN